MTTTTTATTATTIKIKGITYNLLSETPATVEVWNWNHTERVTVTRGILKLQRPRGRKVYIAIRYTNGELSDAS